MKRLVSLVLVSVSSFVLGCGGGGLSSGDGTLAEFNTVVFSSTGANAQPLTVPFINAETRQISQPDAQGNCTNVDVCIGQPTNFTITFGFKSVPLFNASGESLPRPTSPVSIQNYSAVFTYSQGCPAGLPTSDSNTLSGYVPAPLPGGESSAQISITYST